MFSVTEIKLCWSLALFIRFHSVHSFLPVAYVRLCLAAQCAHKLCNLL